MKNIVVLISHSPTQSALGLEALDFLMLAATFEHEVTLVFMHQGVHHLQTNAALLHKKNYLPTFKALPFYDVEQIYAVEEDLEQWHVDESKCNFDVQRCSIEALSMIIAQADEVQCF